MSLFVAGAALLALLFASYSQRRTWLALGSTAISMVAFVGCLFVITSHDQNQLRTRLAWLGSKIQPALDQQTVDGLETVAAYVWAPSCEREQRTGCETTASAAPLPTEPPAMQAAATTSWFGANQDAQPATPTSSPELEPSTLAAAPQLEAATETPAPELAKPEPAPAKQAAREVSQYPVAWVIGEPHVQISSSGSEGFLISGTNVADQALEQIHAVLKPDSSKQELDLVLNVEGHKTANGVIPAGARFSLVTESPNGDGAKQGGGAILAFRYVQAGQRKTSILYLTPSMVGQLANRG